MARKRKALDDPSGFPDMAFAKRFLRSLDLPLFPMRTPSTEVEPVNKIPPQLLSCPKKSSPIVNTMDTDQTSSTHPNDDELIATSSKLTFLTLPSEIRQEIYDHLFSDTMEAFIHIGGPCHVRPTGFSITRVSKVIRTEALPAAWYHLSLRICCWGDRACSLIVVTQDILHKLPQDLRANVRTLKVGSEYANSLVLLNLEQGLPSLERLIMECHPLDRPTGPERTWCEVIVEDCRSFRCLDPNRQLSPYGPHFDDNITPLQHAASRSYELIYGHWLRPKVTHMPVTGWLVEDFNMNAEVSLDAGTVTIKKTPLTPKQRQTCNSGHERAANEEDVDRNRCCWIFYDC